MGIEFECDHRRIGRITEQGESALPSSGEERQLVLEFTEDFRLVPGAPSLTIELRKRPGIAPRLAGRAVEDFSLAPYSGRGGGEGSSAGDWPWHPQA